MAPMDSSSGLVSVLMAAHDAAAIVAESLDSVLRQEGVDLEVVVVNDGSTDGTADRIRAVRDPRIRLLDQPRRGQSAALNAAFAASRGAFIKHIDADDLLAPGHLAAQRAALGDEAGAICSCRWGYFLERPGSHSVVPDESCRAYADPMDWIVDALSVGRSMMGGWLWMIPRGVLEKAGGWDERLTLNNDFEFSIRLALAATSIRFAPEAVYYYRKGRGGTVSSRAGREAMESALLTTELGTAAMLRREDSPRVRRLCADRFCQWMYEFHPAFPDLERAAAKRIAELGGSEWEPGGGAVHRLLRRGLGARRIRWLQYWARQAGWGAVLAVKNRMRRQRAVEAERRGDG